MVTNEESITILTLSGAVVSARMGDLICVLIEHKLIDVLIFIGSNKIHDLIDNFSDVDHYVVSPNEDDNDSINK